MNKAERQYWLDRAASYTKNDYMHELPDKLLANLRRAPLIPESDINVRLERYSYYNFETLSSVEKIILYYVSQGLTDAEIAEIRLSSINTIKTHIKHILAKLNAKSRAHAAAIFAANLD